jgi:predicted transcriptional regulator
MIHDETTNNKLLILFVLEKLEMPISEENLLQICCIDNLWIPYMFCQQIIFELTRSGFITKVNGTSLIALTNDGRTCLLHFYNDIAASVREDVAEFIKYQRISYRKKQEFVADYHKNEDESYTVILKILEVSKPLVDLKFTVDTRNQAQQIFNDWKKKAPEVYRALFDILVEPN